jgi:hypothetical protein
MGSREQDVCRLRPCRVYNGVQGDVSPKPQGFEVIFMGDRGEAENIFKFVHKGGSVVQCVDFEGPLK